MLSFIWSLPTYIDACYCDMHYANFQRLCLFCFNVISHSVISCIILLHLPPCCGNISVPTPTHPVTDRGITTGGACEGRAALVSSNTYHFGHLLVHWILN